MRVVTWNVWWRFGPWELRREAILAVLDDLRPDAVGLQEVWARGEENLAAWLAERLGMHWTWAASNAPERWQERIGDAEVGVGNAVLSRWPIAHRDVVRLPAAGGRDDGRLALHALLDAPGQRVPFFTAHLNHAVHESAVRCRQVAVLAEFVAAHRGEGAFPPVVTGDYNAWPDSDEMRLLGGYKTAPAVAGQVLVDAWEYADPAAPSATWDASNPFAASTFEPSGRCDYIHVGLPGPGGLGRVRSVRRAGDAPVGGVWPSDHAAVVADLASAGPAGDRPVDVDTGVELPVPLDAAAWTVGAVILNGRGEAFAQKRSPDRRLFPDTWDVVGGHVEPGESLLEALAREIHEETGWRLRRVRRLLGVTTWTGDDDGGLRHEADFLVEVDGDLDHPALEWSKHSAYDWFGPADLDRLKENRSPGEFLIHDLIGKALRDRSAR